MEWRQSGWSVSAMLGQRKSLKGICFKSKAGAFRLFAFWEENKSERITGQHYCFFLSDLIWQFQSLMIFQGKIKHCVTMSLKRDKKFPTRKSQWFHIQFVTKRNLGGGSIIESTKILSVQSIETPFVTGLQNRKIHLSSQEIQRQGRLPCCLIWLFLLLLFFILDF